MLLATGKMFKEEDCNFKCTTNLSSAATPSLFFIRSLFKRRVGPATKDLSSIIRDDSMRTVLLKHVRDLILTSERLIST